jgi:nucleotide-binding universal stress UspA family protein
MTDDPTASDDDLSVREPPRVLVPVRVMEGQTLPDALVEFLAPSDVVVLGYHVVPEQTPTEQASMQFEERAQEAVADIARVFEGAGRTAETRVVFTHDRNKTIDRVAGEIGATAILLPNPTGEIVDVLVPIRGVIEVGRLADLVATLLAGSDGQVTLWGLAADEEDVETSQRLDRARRKLIGRGLPTDQIRTETTVTESPIQAIVDRSVEFDAVVMGEGEQTLSTFLLGDTTERVAEGSVAPVLVVRRRTE